MENALITGISSGIGRATAIELAGRGYHVIGAGRSEGRTMPVVEEIRENGGSAEFLHLDLASLASVRSAAAGVVTSGRTIEILINNAGVGMGRGVTEDGFELHFGVNHLGHFCLTDQLRPSFRTGTRIVSVTSAAHFKADGIDFERVQGRTASPFGWQEYCISKLANVLFARELARLRTGWHTYAVHPGMTDTGIFPGMVKPFLRHRLLSPEQGARTIVWCAIDRAVAGESGRYYRNEESREPARAALDDDLARELWRRSEAWCDIASQE